MEKMKLRIKILLSYSVVFPDRHDRIEDLLCDIPSATAIEVLSYRLSQKMNQLIGQHDFEIWMPWLMQTRSDVRNPVGKYVEQHNLSNYAMIDTYAMLLLISKLLVFYNGKHEDLTKDDISNLFLSYLICCDERLELSETPPDNKLNAEKFVDAFLPYAIKTCDFESPRDYRLMLIKCYYLLIEFPRVHAQFATYIDEFCKEKGLSSSKAYLDLLFHVFLELSSGGDPSASLMRVLPDDQKTIQFLDGFSIDTEHYQHDMDFKMIREKPLLKTGTHIYDFMFMRMFLDKAYTGLLFDMRDVLVKRGLLDEREGYGRLKSMLGEDFSERFFFYTLMKRCFGKKYVNYCGEELQKQLGKGMPDFYLRRGNRIFLFECKDAQIASVKKFSGDITIVKNAIYEKYVQNTKGHGKGVAQLANVISDKLPEILSMVDTTAPKCVKYIFPIIVYFDDCFDLEGPNYFLDKELKRIVKGKTISVDYIVRDLVMVNVEQLMRFENYFADDKLKLATLINSYIDFKNRDEINQVFPFNKFLFREAKNKKCDLGKTRWFDEVYQNLVALDKKEQINQIL